MATFDAEGARKAGYSEAEIQGVQKATAAGYTPEEINAFLSGAQPQNSLAGSAKAIGSGLYNMATGMAGMPGDLQAGVRSVLPQAPPPAPVPEGLYGKLISGLERARSALEPPTTPGIRGAIESKTGSLDYQPKTATESALKLGAEFAPGALAPGNVLQRAGQVIVPAAAMKGAEYLSNGNPLAEAGGAVLGSVLAHKAMAPKLPPKITPAQVEAEGSAGYKNPAIDAVQFEPNAIPDLSDDIIDALKRDKRSARVVPNIHNIVEDMKTPVNGPAHTIEDLESTRRLLGEKAQNFNDKTEQAAATLAIKKIDKYMASAPQHDVAAGDIAAANNALLDARSNVAIGKKAGEILQKVNSGEIDAAAANSGMNAQNRIKQSLKPILKSKKQGQNLTAENMDDVRDLVLGSNRGNTLRFAGNLLGGGGGLGAVVAGTAGHMVGGPAAAIGVPAIGFALKMLGNARTRSQAQNIIDNVLARSTAGQRLEALRQQAIAANPALRRLPPAVLAAMLARSASGTANPAQSQSQNMLPSIR